MTELAPISEGPEPAGSTWAVVHGVTLISEWPTEARAHLEAARFVVRELRDGRPNPGELVEVREFPI